MTTTTELERAKAVRAERIEILEACMCAWPLRVLRNKHGHATTCPAAGLIMARRGGSR